MTLRLSVLGGAAKSVLAGEGSSSPAAEGDCFTAFEVLPDGPRRVVVCAGTARAIDADFSAALATAIGHSTFEVAPQT